MQKFHICRAGNLLGYLRILRATGIPADSGLRRANLPEHLGQTEEFSDCWLPYRCFAQFISDMAYRHDIPDLCLMRSSTDLTTLGHAFRSCIVDQPTLFLSLGKASSSINLHNTAVAAQLTTGNGRARYRIEIAWPENLKSQYLAEIRTLLQAQKLISLYLGPAFRPSRILLKSAPRDIPLALDDVFGDIPVLTGQPFAAVEFPRELLSALKPATGAAGEVTGERAPDTLADALERCLPPYLSGGPPPIELAAEMLGTSPRSLQRNLRNHQISYRSLVEKVRFNTAIRLLRDKDISLTHISAQLGYSEQSTFTRAFRRWTDSSPSEYRSWN